jgi:hypothetical protein
MTTTPKTTKMMLHGMKPRFRGKKTKTTLKERLANRLRKNEKEERKLTLQNCMVSANGGDLNSLLMLESVARTDLQLALSTRVHSVGTVKARMTVPVTPADFAWLEWFLTCCQVALAAYTKP